MYFCYFVIISPWKWAWPLIWKKLESSSPKVALCQVWLKLVAQWFRKRRWKCQKFTDRQTDTQTDTQTDRQTYDGRQAIRWAIKVMGSDPNLHRQKNTPFRSIIVEHFILEFQIKKVFAEICIALYKICINFQTESTAMHYHSWMCIQTTICEQNKENQGSGII